MRFLPAAAALALAALALPAAAEVYRWTDESGRDHFTQSLDQVPARYRPEAAARASRSSARVQTYETGAPSAAGARPGAAAPGAATEVHRIPVSRAGTGMLVEVEINGTLKAPFLIDTGASDVLVPESLAQQLGLDLAGARTKRYSTANGVVEHPVVMLRSVSLGGARVENVPASVSPHMSMGLLGLSFFNHFHYQVDAAQGVVTLRRNELEVSGDIRGGRSQAQWQAEFHGLSARIDAVEAEYRAKSESKSRERERLHATLQELQRQLDLLEDEADSARVPMGWRE